jgi:hypothetical protein
MEPVASHIDTKRTRNEAKYPHQPGPVQSDSNPFLCLMPADLWRHTLSFIREEERPVLKEVSRWFWKNIKERPSKRTTWALQDYCSIPLLVWIHKIKKWPLTSKTSYKAAEKGRLDVLEWCQTHIPKLTGSDIYKPEFWVYLLENK